MTTLQAIIFDVDGTLADTERDGHRLSFNQAFADAGLDWDWTVELYGKLLTVTGGKERITHFVNEYQPSFSRPTDFPAFVARLHAAKTQHYTQMLETGKIPLRTGVRRLLNEARAAGVRLAIATTTTPVNVSTLLRYSVQPDAEAWFEVIAAGDVVPKKKPAPDIYTYTLGRLGLDAHQCVALEDSANGVRSAVAAGIPTVVTVSDYCRNDNFNGALLVVDHLGEPNQPLQVLQGKVKDVRQVDVPLLRGLVSASK